MKPKLLILLLLCIHVVTKPQSSNEIIKTNEVISTCGDYYIGSHVNLSWTLGENNVETLSNNDIMFTQGIQQPTFIITSIDDLKDNKYSIKIYPNPASNFFYIEIKTGIHQLTGMQYELYDIEGKRIIKKNINSFIEKIDIQDIESDLYFIRIYSNDDRFIKTFKIEKMN